MVQRLFAKIRDFDVPSLGWDFKDTRFISVADQASANSLFRSHLNAYFRRYKPVHKYWCDLDQTKLDKRKEALANYQDTHGDSNLTITDWLEDRENLDNDVERDQPTALARLAIYDGGGPPIGMISLYNFRVERPVAARALQVSAIFLPGTPKHPSFTLGETWGQIALHILENELRVQPPFPEPPYNKPPGPPGPGGWGGPPRLEIVQWDFILDDPFRGWENKTHYRDDTRPGRDLLNTLRASHQDLRVPEVPDETRHIRRAGFAPDPDPQDPQPPVRRP